MKKQRAFATGKTDFWLKLGLWGNLLVVIILLLLMRHIWAEMDSYIESVLFLFLPWLEILFFLIVALFLFSSYRLYQAVSRSFGKNTDTAKNESTSQAPAKATLSQKLAIAMGLMLLDAVLIGIIIATHGNLSLSGRHIHVKRIDPSYQEKGFRPAGRSASLGTGIARFHAHGIDPQQLPPSMALQKPISDQGQLPQDWRPIPQFKKGAHSHSATISIQEGTSLYGTGEIAGPLLRNGKVTQAYNTDAYAYDENNIQLYQSHPWVLAVRRDGSAYGVLADTTYRTLIDLRGRIRFKTEGHPFGVIVIQGESPQQVLTRLAGLIGTTPLPPLWSLGYHQCRYSYYPDQRVRKLADTFRHKKIPADVIWLDIHYMDEHKVFTFDKERFPDPKGLNNYLHKKDFKSVWIIDPGIKAQKGYFVYEQGSAGDHWVTTAQGKEYHGLWHAGMCTYPDYTRPETRNWWAGLYQDFVKKGMDGIWNDMNKPAIFGVPDKTMPDDNRHAGGGHLKPGRHAQYHNVYGMLMARATRHGLRRAQPDKRPFVLSRANYIGGQRYAATWTGDNVSNWKHLYFSIPMILNLGLSGQPFSGPDIGGFAQNATPELFARWIGVGAFFPFSRGHSSARTIPHEPWSFGAKTEQAARTALERRYRLMPYLYTLFWQASRSGLPVMRPVFFADPADPALRQEDHAFLLGSNILVIPRLTQDGERQPNLPHGIWREFTLVGETPHQNINHPILKIRGGAVVPLGRVVQSTQEKMLKPLTLLVSLDKSGKASGTLYEDAGNGYGYQKGLFRRTTYQAVRRNGKTTISIRSRSGQWPAPDRTAQVLLVTDKGTYKKTGKPAEGIHFQEK